MVNDTITNVYDSLRRGSPAIEELREIISFRNLVVQFARRDILTRYKRSMLGIAWTMLNPLGMMLVLSLAFSRGFGQGPAYAAYVLSGLVAWNFFGQTTTASMVNLVWGGGLLNRIYFPRTSFALAAILTGMVNVSLGLVPLLIVMLATRVPIRLSILLVPLPLLLLACFALGVGLLLSTFAVFFPDVAEMYQIALTAWLYLTPIIYFETFLPVEYRFWITHLNPMYYLVRLFRVVTYDGRLPAWSEIWPAAVIAGVALGLGWYLFTNKSDEIAYRI